MSKCPSQQDVDFWNGLLGSVQNRYSYLMGLKEKNIDLVSQDNSLDEKIGAVIDAMNNIHRQYTLAKVRAVQCPCKCD